LWLVALRGGFCAPAVQLKYTFAVHRLDQQFDERPDQDINAVRWMLADVLGSRAQAGAAYDKLMKKADTNGRPIDTVVDLFIALCAASDECNP
jgi:hypothetical protein